MLMVGKVVISTPPPTAAQLRALETLRDGSLWWDQWHIDRANGYRRIRHREDVLWRCVGAHFVELEKVGQNWKWRLSNHGHAAVTSSTDGSRG